MVGGFYYEAITTWLRDRSKGGFIAMKARDGADYSTALADAFRGRDRGKTQ